MVEINVLKMSLYIKFYDIQAYIFIASVFISTKLNFKVIPELLSQGNEHVQGHHMTLASLTRPSKIQVRHLPLFISATL